MKHLLVLGAAFVLGGVGSLYHPFWGLLLYYHLALLRPQAIWEWSLPSGVRWSLAAAAVGLVAVGMNLPRVLRGAKLSWSLLLTLLFGALLLGSCLTAIDPGLAEAFGVEYGKILLMAVVAMLVVDGLWQVKAAAAMALVTLGYLAYEINALYLLEGRLDIYHRGYGGLDNNGAGLMLAMGLPLAYAFGMGARRAWQRWGSWGIGVLIIHAVMMSYSRGAMMAALAGLAWVTFCNRSRAKAMAVVAAGVLVVSVLAGQEIRERFLSTSRYDNDRSSQSRLESWGAAWQIAWENPMLGQGIRNSRNYTQNYGADRFGRTIHSQYLQLAADSGIPALVVYLTLLAVSLANLQRAQRRCGRWLKDAGREREPPGSDKAREVELLRQITVGCAGSLLVFAVGAIFLSLEWFEAPWLLIVLAANLPRLVREHLRAPAAIERAVLTAARRQRAPRMRVQPQAAGA